MANFKIILFNSPSKKRKDGKYPVCFRITHNRRRKYFGLNKYCIEKQWNEDTCRFRKNFPHHNAENSVLLNFEAKANDIIRDFERDSIPFSLDKFEVLFLDLQKEYSAEKYFDKWIDLFKKEGRLGTASPYTATKNAIIEFVKQTRSNGSVALKLQDINYKILIEFEHWLRTYRCCVDSAISVYMRTLRSLYNKAIKEMIVKEENYPFREYSISERLKTKSVKRAISKEVIHKIKDLTFPEGSKEKFAQDIFMFSYFTRGMNFADIAHLKPSNIMNNRVHYVRKKTGVPFNIRLLDIPKEIVERYKSTMLDNEYLFPIFHSRIHTTPKKRYHRRKTVLKSVNEQLKTIAELVGEKDLRLTTYVSRHSYATILRRAGQDISKISEALGHQSEKVTELYLKEFENDELDRMDEEML